MSRNSRLSLLVVLLCGCGQDPSPTPDPAPRPTSSPAPEAKDPASDAKARQAEAALQADLGDAYLKHQRFAEAAACFRRAIEVTRGLSENAVCHMGLAAALKNLGNAEEAAKNLETAVEIFRKIHERASDDQKEVVVQQICLIYRELGRRQEAVAWAEKIAGEGREAGDLAKRARLYAKLGESALAIDTFKAALKKAGDAPGALALQLEFADYLAQNQNVGEARRLAEDVKARAQDRQVQLGAKRLLIRIYDTLGILDKVDLGTPPPGEGKKEEPAGTEERKGEDPK
ncbi:MAG: DUF3856 domain-containing protein [Planctomycetes bacterium]|nr:DUF3856 domain-containing protein [Planctomycetota bacterium]